MGQVCRQLPNFMECTFDEEQFLMQPRLAKCSFEIISFIGRSTNKAEAERKEKLIHIAIAIV